MDRKIVFFDIDGTILDEESNIIPQSTLDAIIKLKENGHLAFINTGRTECILPKELREVGFDGFVCGCGTYIQYKDEVLLDIELGKELSKEIALDFEKYKLDGVGEGRKYIFFPNSEDINHGEVIKIKKDLIEEGFPIKSLSDVKDLFFDKFILFVNEDSDFKGFYEKYKGRLDFIERSEDFYEVVPKGYSKASGIEFLINHLDIPHENTFAIGDSTNDLSMLEYVENSIAMGNSNEKLFPLVSYVTKDIMEDGIYHALSHYGII